MQPSYVTSCLRNAAVYIFVSYRLFLLTGILKGAVVPNKTGKEMLRNYITFAVAAAAFLLAGKVLIGITGWKNLTLSSTSVTTQPHFDP